MQRASRFPVAFLVVSVAACRGPRPPEVCEDDCADSSSSEVDPGIQTVTGKPTTDSTSNETSSDASDTTGDTTTADTSSGEAEVLPEITDMSVSPELLLGADWVTVEVHADNADRVAITVGKNLKLELERLSETEFGGEFTVPGSSWNGTHVVEAIAWLDNTASEPETREFVVDAPAAGTEVWLMKDAPNTWSYGTALDTTPGGEVIELFTTIDPGSVVCHLRRWYPNGTVVWPGGSRELMADGECIGEAVKIDPDGTIWAAANVYKNGLSRWYLWHTSSDGELLEPPMIGNSKHIIGGLDVNTAGDLVLCGGRPATKTNTDAWVQYLPMQGTGWTIGWDYIPHWEGNLFSDKAEDCIFLDGEIIVVGETFGRHDPDNVYRARGFLVEYNLSAKPVQEHVDVNIVNTTYLAVSGDAHGKYAVVGTACGYDTWPCTHWGFLRRLSSELKTDPIFPIKYMASAVAVKQSPAGYLVVAGQLQDKNPTQNFVVQGWSYLDNHKPIFQYTSLGTDSVHAIRGISLDALGYIYGVGAYLSELDQYSSAVLKLHPL